MAWGRGSQFTIQIRCLAQDGVHNRQRSVQPGALMWQHGPKHTQGSWSTGYAIVQRPPSLLAVCEEDTAWS